MPAAPINGLNRPRENTFISLPNATPMTVSRQNAIRPRTRISSVAVLRNFGPTIVEPIARPRNSVTTLASSFDDAPTSRSTTFDSRIRLPSISMPISGVANGTRTPTTTVTTIGKRIRVRCEISRLVYGITMARSLRVVMSRMIGGMMIGTRLM